MTQHPSHFPQAGRRARTAAALALLAWSVRAFAAPDWDLLGVKLGMTEAEARAAFQAAEPGGKISAQNSAYNYSDKVNSFKTPPFLNTMELTVTRLSIQRPLKVWFSGPLGEARVIAVARNESNLPSPATNAQFRQSLQGKYGKPTALEANGALTLWEETGKPSCIRSRGMLEIGEFAQVTGGFKDLSQAVQMLEAVQLRPNSGLPSDLATCGTFLYYTTGMDPVKSVTAGLFDVGAIMKTWREREAWVEKLETEAIRKREGQAQAPRL
jgi:hypothetical protein